LLDSKLWYNQEEVLILFDRLLELMNHKNKLKGERLLGKQAKLNGDIKLLIEVVKNYV